MIKQFTRLPVEKLFKNIPKNCIRSFSNMIKTSMEKHGVVPDVICIAPPGLANVVYEDDVIVNEGNILTPSQVKSVPQVFWVADEKELYTVCMTDPDAPSRFDPSSREWHHWLVGNISGLNFETGETLSAYVGSGPPKGTGLHRYVFLVYKQNGKITFDEPRLSNTSGADRDGFSIRKFALKYNLGDPIAGNFYQAEWDEYVPTLYKQLGAK